MRLAATLSMAAAFAAAMLVPVSTQATGRDYQVGDVIIYQNPNDGTPPRKGRVTRADADKIWVDFKEFQPDLNIGEASKVLYRGTNAVDDWTKPASAGQGGATAVPTAQGAPPPEAPPPPADPGGFPAQPPPGGGCAAAALPTAQAASTDVLGKWSTLQIGHTVIFAPGDGYVYQRQEIGAQAGDVTIRPDGTYLWNSKSQGLIQGRWRQATADELRGGFGPTGIRLIHGENGWDYNVQRRPRTSASVPDSIAIWTSGYQVNGYRVR